MKHLLIVARTCCALAGLFVLIGCDDDDPDYKPPAGQGAIFVNNNTSSDLIVYVDGNRLQTVQDYDDRAYDLNPGVYRVVIDEDGGDRTYRDDVDVLDGKLTVLDVAIEPFGDDFDVEVFFRSP